MVSIKDLMTKTRRVATPQGGATRKMVAPTLSSAPEVPPPSLSPEEAVQTQMSDMAKMRTVFKKVVMPLMTMGTLAAMATAAVTIADKWNKVNQIEHIIARLDRMESDQRRNEVNQYLACMMMRELLDRLSPKVSTEGEGFKMYSGPIKDCVAPGARE